MKNEFIFVDLWIKCMRIVTALLIIFVVGYFEKSRFYQLYSESSIIATSLGIPLLGGFDSYCSKKLKADFINIYYFLLILSGVLFFFICYLFNLSFIVGCNTLLFNYYVVSWKVKVIQQFRGKLLSTSILFLFVTPLCIIYENTYILLAPILLIITQIVYFLYTNKKKKLFQLYRSQYKEIRCFSSQKIVDQGGMSLANIILVSRLNSDVYYIASSLIKTGMIAHSLIYTKLRNLLFGCKRINFKFEKRYLMMHFVFLTICFQGFLLFAEGSFNLSVEIIPLLCVVLLISCAKKETLFWPNAYPKIELIACILSLTFFILFYFCVYISF